MTASGKCWTGCFSSTSPRSGFPLVLRFHRTRPLKNPWCEARGKLTHCCKHVACCCSWKEYCMNVTIVSLTLSSLYLLGKTDNSSVDPSVYSPISWNANVNYNSICLPDIRNRTQFVSSAAHFLIVMVSDNSTTKFSSGPHSTLLIIICLINNVTVRGVVLGLLFMTNTASTKVSYYLNVLTSIQYFRVLFFTSLNLTTLDSH